MAQRGRPPSITEEYRSVSWRSVRPLHRASERDPARVEQWQREEFPAIQRQAKADNAMIFFADAAGRLRCYAAAQFRSLYQWPP
jgi:hypothetical protein